jgi:hypothetical protein
MVPGSATTSLVSDDGTVVSDVEPSAPQADKAINDVAASANSFFFMGYS